MEPGEAKMQRLHIVFSMFPVANQVIVRFVMTFFRKCLEFSKKNQVNSAIVGKNFGPAFMRPRGDNPQEMYVVLLPKIYILTCIQGFNLFLGSLYCGRISYPSQNCIQTSGTTSALSSSSSTVTIP